MSLKPLKKFIRSCLGPSRTNKTGDLSDIPTRKTPDELEWERRKKFVVETPKDAFRFLLEVKMNGQSHLVEMWSFDKVFDIKAQIMVNFKIPFGAMVVMKDGTVLDDEQTLKSYGIGVNGTVHVCVLKERKPKKMWNVTYFV